MHIVADIILLKASKTTTRGAPFIKTEKSTIEIQKAVHACHFSPKPLLYNKNNKNCQFTWSYAFSRSNLHNKLGNPDLSRLS